MVNVQDFESCVLHKLLSGEHNALILLRKQLESSRITKREYSGAGFFSHFEVPAEVPRIPGFPTFSFGDVMAQVSGLQYGAGFVLHVRNGQLDYLEGYTFGEPWPKELTEFTLSYKSQDSRDFTRLPG